LKPKIQYEPGDKVYIPDLETVARVLAVWVTTYGVQYEVRFLTNGDYKKEYLFEDEIKKANA